MKTMKELIRKNYPSEYQIDLIKPELTSIDILKRMVEGEDVYEFVSIDGTGFDSMVREEIFTIISEELNLDYDDLYYLWLNETVSDNIKKVLEKN